MATTTLLPPELLSIILELVCRGAPPNTEKTAHILGLVSKLWRAIVLSTPSIWTVFYVGNPRQTKHLQNTVDWSGDLPLDIHIVDESSRFAVIREQLSKLDNKANRWQSLKISHPDAVTILEKMVPSALPGIRTLSIKAPPRPLCDYYPFVPDYPSPPTFSLSWTSLQLPHLQTLELIDIIIKPKTVLDFLDFLQTCTELHRLVLDRLWEGDTYDTPRSVTLQALREFELRGTSSSNVLRWIIAPNLQRLVVEKTAQARIWSPVEISSHYATATDVTLIRFSPVPVALRNIIRAVPLVSSLTLLEFDFRSPDAFSAEAVLQEQALPCLTTLHIQGTFSLYLLQRAVEVHRATLKTVEVHCFDLGLVDESLAREYQERDETLEWLKGQSWFTFKINHGSGVFGDRYWSHQDHKWRRRMKCTPGHCEIFP